MKLFRANWIPVTLLILWTLLSWYLGEWLGIHKPGIYYLRGGLAILGIVGFVGYLLMRPTRTEAGNQRVSPSEMDDSFDEATSRLQANGIKQLAALPAVIFLGDSDSAKTSIITKSDIAQLLAGQAQQDVSIVPTRALNLWLAKNTVLVDPAGAILNDAGQRKKLFRRFSPVALGSVMGSRQLPARSVVFTVSCETLLSKGGAEAIAAKARQFQAILAEAAQEIGSHFPVYVLFTKADKLSYFRDYVENLSEQEASDVLGVTLPLETEQGVYAQRQTKRVDEAFRQLYYQLADRRPAYLIREHKPAALPNIYEFPREFNKLRELVTSFLVDLCRPNQVGQSPFLRGFYFTGIRAITVSDVAPAALQIDADDSAFDSGATRMFTPAQRSSGSIAADARELGARKIAQWVYLAQFLPGVILADHAATSISASNVKLNLARRLVLAGAAAAALLMGIWWTISFSNNRALVNGVLDAARSAPATPSLDGLQRLDRVKNALEKLNYFEENDRPWSYGAFLYSGDDARESVRKAYYGLFRRYLLQPTQQQLVQECTQPDSRKPQAYYYDTLKSYLITTEFHDKSVPEFLTPTLLKHWEVTHPVEQKEEDLARLNFDFYARELLKHNEYWPRTTADAGAVGNCRDYLNKLGQTDPIYRIMLADARGRDKALVFNSDHPGTEPTVINKYPVEPEFTKAGFDRFQGLLKNIDKYANGEPWVLGEQATVILDRNKLRTEVEQLYRGEFIKKWLMYLQATRVVPYGSRKDAIAKLDQLSGSRSALLQALCVAGENTAVSDKDIGEAFQPVQVVTPSGCSNALVSGTAGPYMTKLVSLQEELKNVDDNKPETVTSAQRAASEADATVKGISLSFKGASDEAVTSLLKAPIYHMKAAPPPGVNEKAGAMCDEISSWLRKYPFNSAASQDATLQELDAFLKKPEGGLWKFVSDPALAPYLVQFGNKFRATSAGEIHLRPQFVEFLNRAAELSSVFYGANGQAPGFRFTMTPVAEPEVVEHMTLKIDGAIQSTDAHGSPTKEFDWPGDAEGLDLEVRFTGGTSFKFPRHPGIWGIWRFMDAGKEIQPNEFEWKVMIGNDAVTTPGGPARVRFAIDPSKSSILRPHYFSLSCVSKAI